MKGSAIVVVNDAQIASIVVTANQVDYICTYHPTMKAMLWVK